MCSDRQVDEEGRGHGLGKRKTSVAGVVVSRGTGLFTINGHTLASYFPTAAWRFHAYEPLRLTDTMQTMDVVANVHGGGPTGD